MCLSLFFVLIGLVAANQLIGTSYGAFVEGFQKDKFFRGLYKMAVICIGYGMIAIASHLARDYVPAAEYMGGLLLDPIARYFVKLAESLKSMIGEKNSGTEERISRERTEEEEIKK